MLKKTALTALAAMAALVLAGCEPEKKTSDRIMGEKQEQLVAEAASQVDMPAIVNFQEKRMMKMILELRDQTISTVTYITDMNGKLHKLCDSVGYGLPYATQYTNPMKVVGGMNTPSTGNVAVPQADPNGLFSPASADGTWVMCLNPTDQKVRPVFVEPRVVTSPFPLNVN